MANGFVLHSGIAPIDELFSRGGMSSMLTTIWLILGALSYAAIVEHAGFLGRLIEPAVAARPLDRASDRDRHRSRPSGSTSWPATSTSRS